MFAHLLGVRLCVFSLGVSWVSSVTPVSSTACLPPSCQRLAVDVSIWLTQFVKAMRDADGNTLPNAHIVGTLRRLLKV